MGHVQMLKRLFELETPAAWEALAPGLEVAARVDFRVAEEAEGAARRAPPPGGVQRHDGLVAPEVALAMRRAVLAVTDAGLPPVFAYVFDALWEPLSVLAPFANASLGPFDVLADVWAFRIEPGASGWPPHRGFVEDTPQCTTLNVWIALGRATRETSCMFAVPLDRDPSFPTDLASTRAPEGAEIALEVSAGDVLAWDARVLHWGGPMSETATEPRVSATFTLRSRACRLVGLPVLDLGALDLRARLDLVAGEIVKYQEHAKVAPDLLEWARLTLLTRRMGARLHAHDAPSP
jgi:hypothetical protein